jgi:glycerol-3-phosphate dehydrogenase (NAD(P)+)
MEKLRALKAMLSTDFYHVSLSADVTGVECAVAMKNAYALGVTLAVGLAERLDGKQHYNSQAALFGQSVREMRKLLALTGGGDDNIIFGAGDLYVTIFGGRTRLIGTLLGRGLSFEEAMKELSGVTLESIVIATRTAQAVKALIACGKAQAASFPLLLHIDDIINGNAPVAIPWAAFTADTAE